MTWNMKKAPDYDSWLLQGSGFDDDEDLEVGDIVFNMKWKGGTIRVDASITREYEEDEDGRSSYINTKLNYVNWCFSEDFEVVLDEFEEEEIKTRAKFEVSG